MRNNNSEPQLAQETVNKINSIINKNKDKIFILGNNNSEPLSYNFISLDRFGHSFEIKSFETLNKEDYIFAPSNQFKNGLAIHKDLANEIENAIKAFTYPSNEKIYDIARQVGMAIGAQNQFSLPNWELSKNDTQEPHIITVGMGSWRKLKSKEPYRIHNAEQKNIKILDIGEVYDSARKLDANLAIGLSSDIKDIENMTTEETFSTKSDFGNYFNRQGNLIGIKPFVSENEQLGVINIIDIGKSYERIVEELINYVPDIKNEINPKFTKENDELLRKTIDNYFLDKKIGTLSESDNKNFERIFREARKLYAMPHNIITDEENAILPVIKPFFEEKQIPTEREFKEEAKKLKVSGNFSSLGAAQNELARRYGFKEYRAIKSRFVESLKSYDNIRNILINTSKLNKKENDEIVNFFYKFGRLFRKLNISTGTRDFESMFSNEPILYYKTMERLEIDENSLMGFYRYFLTKNSIVFGQIKRNISILSQDRKISLLSDLNDVEIDENDAPAFGLFANLLAYHIGKSACDVTLHKNEDGTVEQNFEEYKSSNSHNNKQMNQLKKLFDKMGIKQNQNSEYEMDGKIKTYNSEIGFIIYFLHNISLDNQYIISLLKNMKNIPEDFEINYHQFLSVNTLNIFSMQTQPSKALFEEFEKMILSIIK